MYCLWILYLLLNQRGNCFGNFFCENAASLNNLKIVGVQSSNKCCLWNVERKEWAGLFV
jgi:hypothetical protein